MQRSYLLIIFMFFKLSAFAQLHETFSDSDFTANPVWMEETGFFTISPELELVSIGPNASSQLHLSTINQRCRDTEWEFYTRLDFDITSSNWAKIYLTSDRPNTEDNPKGYYVKFDGNNNSVDLYRQDSTTHTKLISGKNGRAGKTSMNIFRVKVICDPSGNWHLFSDSTALGNFYVKEGTALDTTFSSSLYSGVYFAHSATRRNLFYFDDFSIRPAPLSLMEAKTISSNSIELVFNRALEPASVNALANYSFLPSSLTTQSVSLDPNDHSKIMLVLSHTLNPNINYSISIHTLTDELSNPIGPLNTANFQYRINTVYGDVILSELFPDPSPVKELPELEYIELLNRTNDTLELQNFTLSDGSSNAVFPAVRIAPKQYLILCASGSVSGFSNYSPVVGIPNLPSLNNSGDHLTLKNEQGVLLHEVNYSDLWYEDNDKKEGGWSLEIIDTNNPCIDAANWIASMDPSGGTPGKINSVSASKPDLTAPQLLSAYIIDSTQVELIFSEKPEPVLLSDFQFDKDINIKNIQLSEIKIILTITNTFTQGELYTLNFSGIKDCSGNSSTQLSTTLIMPQEAVTGDLVINEILFNPKTGGYDFVELYNRSSKYINLKHWQLANIEDSLIANHEKISSEPLILVPQAYIAFTENKSILLNHYPLGKADCIIEVPDLPSYNDDEGTVVLQNNQNELFDRFDYSEDFHFALIDDKEGVSLERISSDESADNSHNWQSASSQSGYATPGYKNSQDASQTSGSQVWIEPKIFTPDQNGDKDFAMIHYKFETSGNMVNITIYDQTGREMIRLAKNELLATEGFYRWDGNNTNNERVRSGPYIVYFELFNLNGEVKKLKDVVVVGWDQ